MKGEKQGDRDEERRRNESVKQGIETRREGGMKV